MKETRAESKVRGVLSTISVHCMKMFGKDSSLQLELSRQAKVTNKLYNQDDYVHTFGITAILVEHKFSGKSRQMSISRAQVSLRTLYYVEGATHKLLSLDI